jgi:hypothetical protein
MNIVALKAARNDVVASVFAKILGDWCELPGLLTWKTNLEVAYNHTKRLGSTIGLFSNMPGKLGRTNEELPFFQVQAERLPFKLSNVEGWKTNFGLNEYFKERYSECAGLLVPFLTYATVLYRNSSNQIWNIEVGDWRKREPLVVTFATPKSLVKLALYGHVVIKDVDLIDLYTAKPIAMTVPDFDATQLQTFAAYSDERLIAELMRNRHGKPVFWGPASEEVVIGTYDNVRLDQGQITADVSLINPRDFEDLDLNVVIVPRQRHDTKRSGRKYTKRYITPHIELEVRLLTNIKKE